VELQVPPGPLDYEIVRAQSVPNRWMDGLTDDLVDLFFYELCPSCSRFFDLITDVAPLAGADNG